MPRCCHRTCQATARKLRLMLEAAAWMTAMSASARPSSDAPASASSTAAEIWSEVKTLPPSGSRSGASSASASSASGVAGPREAQRAPRASFCASSFCSGSSPVTVLFLLPVRFIGSGDLPSRFRSSETALASLTALPSFSDAFDPVLDIAAAGAGSAASHDSDASTSEHSETYSGEAGVDELSAGRLVGGRPRSFAERFEDRGRLLELDCASPSTVVLRGVPGNENAAGNVFWRLSDGRAGGNDGVPAFSVLRDHGEDALGSPTCVLGLLTARRTTGSDSVSSLSGAQKLADREDDGRAALSGAPKLTDREDDGSAASPSSRTAAAATRSPRSPGGAAEVSDGARGVGATEDARGVDRADTDVLQLSMSGSSRTSAPLEQDAEKRSASTSTSSAGAMTVQRHSVAMSKAAGESSQRASSMATAAPAATRAEVRAELAGQDGTAGTRKEGPAACEP
mmetsp:Transcript_15780/g.40696  ORF Transcript_15780/g.40696 Transcript_15780/m.40696 type:complete len:456 (+) Transcript_15780:806-2173(+)